ncbi:hypothetical protein B0H16DRAFT_235333 [Mycena metata]|uniref:Uncharacterized protein n=1 Tax=Mycena metata TaxID=1033252 RepID=A0AAD7JQT8_9AGAR|nr:hypothetical protein B0H16DRAFT_235333 [Mycena metata]
MYYPALWRVFPPLRQSPDGTNCSPSPVDGYPSNPMAEWLAGSLSTIPPTIQRDCQYTRHLSLISSRSWRRLLLQLTLVSAGRSRATEDICGIWRWRSEGGRGSRVVMPDTVFKLPSESARAAAPDLEHLQRDPLFIYGDETASILTELTVSLLLKPSLHVAAHLLHGRFIYSISPFLRAPAVILFLLRPCLPAWCYTSRIWYGQPLSFYCQAAVPPKAQTGRNH